MGGVVSERRRERHWAGCGWELAAGAGIFSEAGLAGIWWNRPMRNAELGMGKTASAGRVEFFWCKRTKRSESKARGFFVWAEGTCWRLKELEGGRTEQGNRGTREEENGKRGGEAEFYGTSRKKCFDGAAVAQKKNQVVELS